MNDLIASSLAALGLEGLKLFLFNMASDSMIYLATWTILLVVPFFVDFLEEGLFEDALEGFLGVAASVVDVLLLPAMAKI